VRPLSEQTLYEILEVPVDASEEEIVRAWERAEALYGPGSLSTYTLISPEEAARLAAKLEEALNILLDPAERQRYNARILRRGSPGGGAPTPPPAAPAIPIALAAASRPSPAVREPPEEEPGSAAAAPVEGTPWVADDAVEEVTAAEPAILLSAVVMDPGPARRPPSTPPPREEERHAPPTPHRPTPVDKGLFLPEGASFRGDVLRRAREARGLTIQQVCDRTKITRHHIENLEADRYDRLPAPVYLRGILMAVARELRLDPQRVAQSYLEALAAASSRGR